MQEGANRAEGTVLKAHCIAKAVGEDLLLAGSQEEWQRKIWSTIAFIGWKDGHSHWLLELIGFWETGLSNRRWGGDCSLALVLGVGSWFLALGFLLALGS